MFGESRPRSELAGTGPPPELRNKKSEKDKHEHDCGHKDDARVQKRRGNAAAQIFDKGEVGALTFQSLRKRAACLPSQAAIQGIEGWTATAERRGKTLSLPHVAAKPCGHAAHRRLVGTQFDHMQCRLELQVRLEQLGDLFGEGENV